MTPVDPKTDLVFERVVDVPPELVWKAWTTPELLKQWFTPAPWKTADCEIELWPGGTFRTVMESPEGQQIRNIGCYLEVVPNAKIVWTNALLPGFRPKNLTPDVLLVFTAVIEIEPQGSGTKYMATLLHNNENGRAKHEAMGFHNGWGTAFDQLVAMVKSW